MYNLWNLQVENAVFLYEPAGRNIVNEENALHFDQNVNLFEYQINVWILGYIQKRGFNWQVNVDVV